MIHERYKPGAQSGTKMLSHQGEEAGLVIKSVREDRRHLQQDAQYEPGSSGHMAQIIAEYFGVLSQKPALR